MKIKSMNAACTMAVAGAFLLAPITIASPASAYYACHADQGDTCNGVQALLVGGQGSYATLTEEQMATAFGGYFATYDSRTSVPFPGDAEFGQSIPEGATNLYNAVLAEPAGTVMTIGGVSKGAPSVIEALKLIEKLRETDPTRVPDADHMNVVIYGAPSRIYYAGVWKYRPDLPVTPYDVYMVSAQYDGVADMPDHMFNILAVLNAAKGADMLHVDAAFNTDFTDTLHYKQVVNADGGTTTYILLPYKGDILPLLVDLEKADGSNHDQLVRLSAFLKPIIDSAYTRNNVFQRRLWQDGPLVPPLPAAAPAPAAPPVATLTGTTIEQKTKTARGTLATTAATAATATVQQPAAAADDEAPKPALKGHVFKDMVDQVKSDITKLKTKRPKSETKPEKKKDTTADSPAPSNDAGGSSSSTGSES